MPARIATFMLASCTLLVSSQRLSADDAAQSLDRYGDVIDAGAAVRLGTVRYRVAGLKSGLAFGANDRTLVTTGNHNQSLDLLDAPTGRHIRSISCEGQIIQDVRLSPDRKFAFTLGYLLPGAGGESSIKKWDLQTGTLASTIRLDERHGHLVITPDGETAICGDGALLSFWNLDTGKETLRHHIAAGEIEALAVSPDGQLLAISTRNAVHFWKWQDENQPARVETGIRVVALAFSPDGALLAEGPDHVKEIVLRDVPTRAVRLRLASPDGNRMHVRSLAFSADGKTLASTNGALFWNIEVRHRVNLWDTENGRIRQSLETGNDSTGFVALSQNGRWVATTFSDSLIKVWDLSNGKSLDEATVGHEEGIRAICLSADGRTIVTGSDDMTAHVWDGATGAPTATVRHNGWVRAAALSPDGRLCATSSLDDTVRLLDTRTGEVLRRLPGHGLQGGMRAVAFAKDGRSLASLGDDWYLRRWDVQTGRSLGKWRVERQVKPADANRQAEILNQFGYFSSRAVFSADGRKLFISVQSGQSVSVFDATTGQSLNEIACEDGRIASLAASPDGELLAISADGPSERITLSDGRTTNVSGRHNLVRVRKVKTGDDLFLVPLPENSAGPVQFSPDGRLLAIGLRNAVESVWIFDVRSGEQVQSIAGLRANPLCLGFSSDNSRLGCGLVDGTALIWDLKKSAVK